MNPMRFVNSRPLWMLSGFVLAVALVTVGAYLRASTSAAVTGARGPIPACTAQTDATLPYKVRALSTPVAGLAPTRCEVTLGQFPTRTQYFQSTSDNGSLSLWITQPGAKVNLDRATSVEDVQVGNQTAKIGLAQVAGAPWAFMYWNDGDVALIINARLSPTLTEDKVIEFARAVH